MDKWSTIKKFALWFGIVFIVFTVLAALVNLEFDRAYYTTAAPAAITIYSVIAAMLPYLVAAVLLFLAAFLIPRTIKSEDEKEPEAQEKETEETETQSDLEDVLKETPT